jgi:hypothetical protein
VPHLQWLVRANQKQDAMHLIKDYFQAPDVTQWDENFSKLVQIALQLSQDLLIPIPSIIKCLVSLARSTAPDRLTLLVKFVQDARLCISEGQRRMGEARRMLPVPVAPESLEQIFLRGPESYAYAVYTDTLANVRDLPDLYGTIMLNGFQLALSYESNLLFDHLSRELASFYRRRDIRVSHKLLIVDLIFAQFHTALDMMLTDRAAGALREAEFYLARGHAPRELREHLAVQKLVLFATIDRLAAAHQLLALAEFYETTPVDPSVPVQSVRDLALMAALAVPLGERGRDPLVGRLLTKSRRSTLAAFGDAAENARDPALICVAFRRFLEEFGTVYRVPAMYCALGHFAAVRVVQAVAAGTEEVELAELRNMVRWLDECQLHEAVSDAVKLGLVAAKIDMVNQKAVFAH